MDGYKAVLFAPDGDWVTDCRGDTIEDVIEQISDLGSRWYFFIIRDHGALTKGTQRIVAAHEPFEDMKGRTINTVADFLRAQDQEFHEAALG